MEMELFACFHTMLTKHVDTDVTDVVSSIFEYYQKTYDNYTLPELIDMMHKINYTGKFAWNRKAIIQIIQDKGLPIPAKQIDEPLEYSNWDHYRVRKSLDVVCVKKYNFHIQDGDIIKMIDDKLYMIDCIVEDEEYVGDANPDTDYNDENWIDVIKMYFIDMQTNEERCITAGEFFEILDEEDVTIMQNLYTGLYMDEEQRDYYLSGRGQRYI